MLKSSICESQNAQSNPAALPKQGIVLVKQNTAFFWVKQNTTLVIVSASGLHIEARVTQLFDTNSPLAGRTESWRRVPKAVGIWSMMSPRNRCRSGRLSTLLTSCRSHLADLAWTDAYSADEMPLDSS